MAESEHTYAVRQAACCRSVRAVAASHSAIAAGGGRARSVTTHAGRSDAAARRSAALATAAGLAAGIVFDAVFADPRRGHPVAGFGRAAGVLERAWYAPTRSRGVAYTAVAAGLPVLLGAAVQRGTARRPVLRAVAVAAATWSVLGGTSLRREAGAMTTALTRGDLPAARERLSHLCARDPSGMGEAALARATVESVAENTSDAVVAPLFWGAVAGVPGLLGYRAVNTLDAMVGYRSPRYAQFGWASARLDDVVNWLPSRCTAALTVLLARVVGGSPRAAWRAWRRDGSAHPSPNAGQCEAAAAGALGVRLGGENVYDGETETRPVLGAGGRAPRTADIPRAARLAASVGGAAGALAVVAVAASAARTARAATTRRAVGA